MDWRETLRAQDLDDIEIGDPLDRDPDGVRIVRLQDVDPTQERIRVKLLRAQIVARYKPLPLRQYMTETDFGQVRQSSEDRWIGMVCCGMGVLAVVAIIVIVTTVGTRPVMVAW